LTCTVTLGALYALAPVPAKGPVPPLPRRRAGPAPPLARRWPRPGGSAWGPAGRG